MCELRLQLWAMPDGTRRHTHTPCAAAETSSSSCPSMAFCSLRHPPLTSYTERQHLPLESLYIWSSSTTWQKTNRQSHIHTHI